LKPGIRSKLVPFQLPIDYQAVEKALEVERDIQENQDISVKELPSVKHPRYANIPRFGAFPFRPDGAVGSSLTPIKEP